MKEKWRDRDVLQASHRVIFFHSQIAVYFHGHKNLIHIMAYVHVLDHGNRKHINALHQLLKNQLQNLDY